MTDDIWEQIVLDTDPYRNSSIAIADLSRAIDAFSLTCVEAAVGMAELTEIINELYNDLDQKLSYLHVLLGIALIVLTLLISVH